MPPIEDPRAYFSLGESWGIIINEHNGQYSLAPARPDKEDRNKFWMKWTYPQQFGTKKPQDSPVPEGTGKMSQKQLVELALFILDYFKIAAAPVPKEDMAPKQKRIEEPPF